jgi:hypothetical protein
MTSSGDTDYPWPQKGDDPFELADDWWHNACLNWMHGEAWTGYAEGYKRIADLSVAYVEATHSDQDFLVYPILFNYRQYIELTLKDLVGTARRLLDEPGGVPRGHDLLALWNEAEPLLLRIDDRERETLGNVRACLKRFAKFDPTSESFRYPITKKGKPSLPDKLRHINLRQVRDVVERLSGFFDGASMQASVYLDHKNEMERELAAEADWY